MWTFMRRNIRARATPTIVVEFDGRQAKNDPVRAKLGAACRLAQTRTSEAQATIALWVTRTMTSSATQRFCGAYWVRHRTPRVLRTSPRRFRDCSRKKPAIQDTRIWRW